jgi:histidinol-phosphate phosphatase family protein
VSDKAVFLDKDGTLVKDVPHNADPALLRFMPHAVEGLRVMHRMGFKLVVASNQSGVARGLFTERDLERVEDRLGDMLLEAGVPLSGFYFCPHMPGGSVPEYAVSCVCRKPKPGLLQRAARELSLDLSESWIIGDILDDVEAGRRAGCRTVLLDNGHETEWVLTPSRRPHFLAADLSEAADLIRYEERPLVF